MGFMVFRRVSGGFPGSAGFASLVVITMVNCLIDQLFSLMIDNS